MEQQHFNQDKMVKVSMAPYTDEKGEERNSIVNYDTSLLTHQNSRSPVPPTEESAMDFSEVDFSEHVANVS